MSETPEQSQEAPAAMQCDFCKRTVPSVRRVALDGDYERLRTPHAVMYSCPECFEKKDRARRAGDGQPG